MSVHVADGGLITRDNAASVLVVDDLPEAVELMTDLLADRHNIRQAYNGKEALSHLDESVDVVLLDRKMPGLSGYEVVEEIRARNHEVCIAIVSASEPDFDIVDVAFDEYLTKPVDIEELNTTVEQLLDRRDRDERQRKYEATKAKLAVLEANKTQSALETSDAYATLTRRLQELENGFDSTS